MIDYPQWTHDNSVPLIGRFAGRYKFLSNFYPCFAEYGGMTFETVEHAYQYAKQNTDIGRRAVEQAKGPGMAKRVGQRYEMGKNWDNRRVGVMRELLRFKFGDRNPVLRDKLIDTGDAVLCEGNYWNDRFWGVCKGYGYNHLGVLLMEVRSFVRVRR